MFTKERTDYNHIHVAKFPLPCALRFLSTSFHRLLIFIFINDIRKGWVNSDVTVAQRNSHYFIAITILLSNFMVIAHYLFFILISSFSGAWISLFI